MIDMSIKTKLDTKDFVLFLVLVSFLLTVVYYWDKTWDDSAITLSFSRNLIKYGDIIPSQFSDRVEGYSTFLWMIINAAFFKLGFGEKIVLTTAKYVSTILSLVNILLFWHLVQEKIVQRFYQYTILILYAINLQTVTSATFGMETALYAFLVLISYILYQNRNRSWSTYITLTVTTSLLILIRHEGLLFLIPFVIETYRNNPKRFLREPFLYFWGLVFLAYHIWHFTYFGELLTNPMIAKRQLPYFPELNSPESWLTYYLAPFFRIVSLYPFLFILLGFRFVFFRNHKVSNTDKSSLMLGIALTGMFIMLITGKSWNADADRLSYPALAFLLLIAAQYLDGFSFKEIPHKSQFILISIIWVGIAINSIATYQSFITDLRFDITVKDVEKRARLETLIREYIPLTHITLASPDMGGLLLFYGDGIRVIDLGLLCNQKLAKQGYEALNTYVLTEEKPEIIEIQGIWITPFANSNMFYANYMPVKIVDKNEDLFIFIRNDLIKNLERQRNASKIQLKYDANLQEDIAVLLKKYQYYLTITFAN